MSDKEYIANGEQEVLLVLYKKHKAVLSVSDKEYLVYEEQVVLKYLVYGD